MSGDSDDAAGEEPGSDASANNENLDDPMVGIQTAVDIQNTDESDPMLNAVTTPLGLAQYNPSNSK